MLSDFLILPPRILFVCFKQENPLDKTQIPGGVGHFGPWSSHVQRCTS